MSLIPPAFLDKVVALGTSDNEGNIRYAASGFLYGQPSGTQGRYYVYLVTNRHVVTGNTQPADTLQCPRRGCSQNPALASQ